MTRLVRDRLTWLTYGLLGVYAYFLYGFGPVQPLLREEQGTSRAVSALHGTAFAVGIVVSGLVSARLVTRFGRRRVIWGSVAVLCAGLAVFVAGTALPVTLLGVLVAAVSGATMLNTVVAVLSDHHGASGAAAITEANAVGAWVGLAAPAVIGGCIAVGVGWRAGLLLTVVLAASLAWAACGVRVPDAPPGARGQSVGTGPADPLVPAALSGDAPDGVAGAVTAVRTAGRVEIGFALAVSAAVIGTEFCMTLWASDLLRERTGAGDDVATAALTALVLGMAVGRTFGARLALRRSPDALLCLACGLAVLGFAVFWRATSVPAGLVGLLLTGLGLSLQYPLAISRTITLAGARADATAAQTAVVCGLAVGIAPFALGAMADVIGVQGAFLLVPGLLVGAVAGVALSRG